MDDRIARARDLQALARAGGKEKKAVAAENQARTQERTNDKVDWRSFRIVKTFEGCQDFTLQQTYADLIELLRSDELIDNDLRLALADALERGHQGDKIGVRLRLEAEPTFFKAATTAEAQDRLLEAGLYTARERAKGRGAGAVRQDLPELFGIDDAEDYERRAKRIYKHFRQWLESNYAKPDLFGWRQTNDIHSYEREDTEEENDYFDEARAHYLQAIAPQPLNAISGTGMMPQPSPDP